MRKISRNPARFSKNLNAKLGKGGILIVLAATVLDVALCEMEVAVKMFDTPSYRVGEPVIFRASKRSTHPGPRAQHVRPEISGDGYQYEVDKYWAVREVAGNQLVLLTRRGKTRVVDAGDPALRRAGWWERIAYKDRFPQLDDTTTPADSPTPGNRESGASPSPH